MFCPKCAMKNIEGAHFCRSCGANISLVPQALTGQLPTPDPPEDDYLYRRRRRRGRALSPDYAIRSIITGIAFAVMAVMVSRFAPGSARWWFWLLVPAIMLVARGFSEFARIKSRKSEMPKAPQPMMNAVRTPELQVPGTGELMTPVPSVTEGTTRHLGTNAETRPFEFSNPHKPS